MTELQALGDEAARAGVLVVVLQLALILVATLVALRFAHSTANAALTRLFAREATEGTAQALTPLEVERRRQTLDGLIYPALRFIILAIAFLMVLQVLALDIGPAIAGLGIIGLALGLGAQSLVRDYVAGAFVLIENQYSEGDVVAIAGVTGTVEDINLRRTTVRSIDGTLHHVAHGLIEVSSNQTRTWARVEFDVPFGYDTDIEQIREIINDAGRAMAADPEWRERVLDAPSFLRIGTFGEYGMRAKVLGTIRAVDRWDATGEMRRLILERAAAAGVKLGWPTDAAETMAAQTNPALPSRRQR